VRHPCYPLLQALWPAFAATPDASQPLRPFHHPGAMSHHLGLL